MKILVLFRQHSAVGYYRSALPAKVLRTLGHEVTSFDLPYRKALQPSAEEWLLGHLGEFDLLLTDRAVFHSELQLLSGFRHYSPNLRMIVDFDDDFLNVPQWNLSYNSYQPGQENREVGLQHLRLAEMTTVSTGALLRAFESKTHAISCAPNYIDSADWPPGPIDPDRPSDPLLRVLYGGASGHYGDLDQARSGLERALNDTSLRWRLVCFGTVPVWVHDYARRMPGRVLVNPWVPFEDYAHAIAWGGFDVALAPLAPCPFNEAKCLVAGTKIATPYGIRKIEEIEPSNRIWQETGYRYVSAKIKYEKRPTLRITTERGYQIEGTPNHRLRSDGEFVEMSRLGVGSIVDLGVYEHARLDPVWVCGPFLRSRKMDKPYAGGLEPGFFFGRDWGRFVGLVLGDGCISSSNATVLTIDSKDADVVTWLEHFGERIGVSAHTTSPKDGRKCKSVSFASRNLQWLLLKIGMGDGQTRKKKLCVPEIILRSDREVIAAFLQGLFDTDGTVGACGCSLSTKSEQLARDVQYLLLGFGVVTTVRSGFNKTFKRTYWSVNLGRQASGLFQERVGFLSMRKRLKLSNVCAKPHSNAYREWHLEDTISKVEQGEADVYDIEVPDGSYYLANGIVSHNSNIKALEAAVQRIPFLCSNVGPYSRIPDGCAIRVPNTPGDWYEGLRALLEDRSLRERLTHSAAEWVRDEWTIDHGLRPWQAIVEKAVSLPRIETLEDTRLPSDPEPPAPEGLASADADPTSDPAPLV